MKISVPPPGKYVSTQGNGHLSGQVKGLLLSWSGKIEVMIGGGLENPGTLIEYFHKFVLCIHNITGPRSAVGNVSGHRCVSDCRSRGHEFDPGPVPYFRGD